MNRGLTALVSAQFLSAFGDNAILFVVIAMLLKSGQVGSWYVPALQSAFLVAYVTLTPWVGALAERHPKPRVLMLANLLKALGALFVWLGIEPLLAYGIIGVGAAAYGPAKYGIIPELTSTDNLVRANSWVEGATIGAILLGTIGGAKLADISIPMAQISVIGIYLVSSLATLLLPRLPANRLTIEETHHFAELLRWIRELLGSAKTRMALLALSLFWACSATLRIVLVAWAPAVLHTESASDIAELTLFLAIGIIMGATLAPRLIPLTHIRRTRFTAYLLGILFLLLAPTHDIWVARGLLLGAGIAGGLFVVPLNAHVQAFGQTSIGSGSAVAVQNLFQNSAILISMGLYTLSSAYGVTPVASMTALGVIVFCMTLLVSVTLPKQPPP